MFKWLKQYQAASPQTKYFIFNWVIYSLAIIVTTVYCYGRLDFVRSYKTQTNEMQHPQKNKVIEFHDK